MIEHMALVAEVGAFEPLRQVALAGRRFQHDVALHHSIDPFGRCFGGIEAEVDDQVPLACFRRRWWSSWGM